MVKPNIFPIYLLLHSRNPSACRVTPGQMLGLWVNESGAVTLGEENTPPFQGALLILTFAVFAWLIHSSGQTPQRTEGRLYFLRETRDRPVGFSRKEKACTEIHTVFEHTNQEGLVGLSIPPVHRDLHVVNVRQGHVQLPVEGRAWTQSAFHTDRYNTGAPGWSPGAKPHPQVHD